nr:HDIG domain-containing metalloprotein [Lentibacillus sediminis]
MKKKLQINGKTIKLMMQRWLPVGIGAGLTAVFFFFVTLNNIQTETYDLERFSTADETIRSPVTVEKEQETERKVRETVQAVADRYTTSEEVTEDQIAYVNEIFDAIDTLEEEQLNVSQADQEDAAVPVADTEKVQALRQILSTDIAEAVSSSVLTNLINASKNEREAGKMLFTSALKESLENGVRRENLETSITNVKDAVKYSNLEMDTKEGLLELSEFAVAENSFFDMEATMEARRTAASNVDPVVVQAGEVIVREGQTITNEIYEDLELTGLLDSERNLYPIIGLLLFILLLSGVIGHELGRLQKLNELDRGKAVALVTISFLVVSLMKVVSLYAPEGSQLIFMVPAAMGALLIKQLIQERTAIIFSIVYALIASIIFNQQIPALLNFEAGIYFLFTQLAAVFFLVNMKDRLALVKAGFGIMTVNVLTVLLFLFLSFEQYDLMDLFIYAGFGIVSAFLSVVFTIGLLPFFETGLGILSDSKLLQLSSPNQPLLKKLLTEAPGTYHHSVMVANLSETACEAIGANGLLARVGAYYHDLGKTVRPHYFIENQLAIKNPHDRMPARESAKIIISHTTDGAKMLKANKLPVEIIDIARQHHGTTLLKFFYYKEKESNKRAFESHYRYPGPRPQTKEAGVICICDSVEAAVRSLKEPTEAKIEEIVSSIIKDRLTDGQLDETPLTLKDLDVMQRTICGTLKGIFHSRIQYPMKEAK